MVTVVKVLTVTVVGSVSPTVFEGYTASNLVVKFLNLNSDFVLGSSDFKMFFLITFFVCYEKITS